MKIALQNVYKRKLVNSSAGNKNSKRTQITAVDNVSFHAQPSEVFTIIGPSGSGKSTLLRLIVRLEEPDSGTITLNGKTAQEYNIIELRRSVAFVPQVPSLFEGSIEANLCYPISIKRKKMKSCDARELMIEKLRLLGLNENFLSRDNKQLSQGEKQRICIARALMNEPRALLLDEPTSALDPSAALRLLRMVREIQHSLGITIIIVTHHMEHAREVGDRTLLLVAGKVIEENSTTEFFQNPQQPLTKKFLLGQLDNESHKEE